MDKLRVCGKIMIRDPMLILNELFRRNDVFTFDWYNGGILRIGS